MKQLLSNLCAMGLGFAVASCGSSLMGGGSADLEKGANGSSLSVAQGTFDEDHGITFNTLGSGDLEARFHNRNGTIAFEASDQVEVAAEMLIGNGTANVTLKKDITVGLAVPSELGITTSSAMFHAATLSPHAAIFCQLYSNGGLGEFLAIGSAIDASNDIITFSFGKGKSISGFLCLLLVNQDNETPSNPTVTSGGEPIAPTGIGGE